MALDVRQLEVLTREGVGEAARRRVVPVVVAVSLLSLLMMNSCTSCDTPMQLETNVATPANILGFATVGIYLVLGLWSILLAGLLATDHLSAILEDDSALLVLSRPVSRETLVVSRLLGSLGVSLGAAVLLLGGATFMVVTRSGLALAPALYALLAVALSGATLAALGMTAALYLARIGTFMLLIVGLGVLASINIGGFSGAQLGGIYGLVNDYGPPFASSILATLLPWSGSELPAGVLLSLLLRQVVWLGLSLFALVYAFTNRELTPPPS